MKWYPLKGYEKSHRITKSSYIKTIDRLVNRNEKFFSVKGRILKPTVDIRYGHLYLCLYKDGKVKRHHVGRLVLETFVGPCPSKMECRHLDNNPSNNNLSNLKWGSRKKNMHDKFRNGTNPSGDRNPSSKLTWLAVYLLRAKYLTGLYTQRKLSSVFKMSEGTVSNIVHNRSWVIK